MSALHPQPQLFVVPPLTGPVSGGTVYNRELCGALAEASCPVRICALETPELPSALEHVQRVWVDSLYLRAMTDLRARARGTLGMLTHYLPSFVVHGRAVGAAELSPEERAALSLADCFAVTSPFMKEALEPLLSRGKSVLVIPPGSRAALAPCASRPSLGLRALLIGNVLPGKGVEPLLRALAQSLVATDRFELRIVGSLELDRAYAERCRRLVAASKELGGRVVWCGALEPERTLELLAEAEVLLSASRMESYGMALSEARVVGVPVLACAGGYAAQHVDSEAGGQLVPDPEALARTCLAWARTPEQVRARIEQARRHAPSARQWSQVARQWLEHTS